MNYGIFNICCDYSPFKLQNNIFPWEINNNNNKYDKIITTQYGTLIKYYDNFYILSTAHGFPNLISNIYFECNVNSIIKKIELNIKLKIIENDIILLSFKNIDDIVYISQNFNFITHDMFSTKLVLDKDDVEIFDNKNKVINLKIDSLRKGKYNLYQYAEDYFYNININNIDFKNFNNITNDFNGLSGYPLLQSSSNNCKFVGIINSFHQDNLKKILFIIPTIYVYRVLNEHNKYNTFQGFCNLYFDYDILEKKKLERKITNNFKNLDYLVVNNTFGISYNYYSNILKEKNLNNLKKNDIILEIDNLPIINGLIFDKNLNINIDIFSYNNLNKSVYDKTKFKIIRKNKNNEFNIKTIEIYNRSINSTKVIKYINKTKFINYKNNIFVELNKNLANIIINNSNNNNLKNIIYNLDTNITNNINDKTILLYKSNIKSFNINSEILILHSINNILINNLDLIKKYIKNIFNNFKFKNMLSNKIIEFNL